MRINQSPTKQDAKNTGSPSGLIVDFPNQRGKGKSSAGKSVSFSIMSEVIIIEKPSKRENQKKSYTKEDYRAFKQRRANDAVYCSRLFMVKKSVGLDLTAEDVCMFRGLEIFISPDVGERAREILQAKKVHVKGVLREQERQRNANEHSASAIARLSRRSSRSHRVRSQSLASAAIGATKL